MHTYLSIDSYSHPIYIVHCTYVCVWVYMCSIGMLMRDAEGRKNEASKVKQTTRQSNTAHVHVADAIILTCLSIGR